MRIYRVVFVLDGVKRDIYSDAPNAEVAKALIQVQLIREGFTNFSVLSATVVGAG